MVGSNTSMPRRFRFAALLGLLAACTGAVAACGGGDDGGSSGDANALLKQTFGENQSVKSGNLDVGLELDAKGLQGISGPVGLKLKGPFETRGEGKLPKLALDLAIEGAGASFQAGVVTTGEKGWLKLQGTTFVVDDATFRQFREGYEKSAADSGGKDSGMSFSALGIDPLRWLKDAEVAGSEEIGGAETDRITARVDVATFLEDVNTLLSKAGQLGGQATEQVPQSLTEQQRKDIESSIKSAAVEIWTGKDDRALRRLRLVIDIDVPEDVRPRAGGLSTGTLTFNLTINDLNEPQEIAEPENARPLSELQQVLGLGGATGSGSGSGSSSGGSGGGGSTGSPGQSSAYLDCLQQAGSDVAKIQQCAELAGQ